MAGPLFVCRHPRRVLEMISRKSSILLLIAISFALSGCDSMLGVKPPVVSTTPNQEQVDYCRKVMYINPEIEIEPIGYYYEYGFQDDLICFKFDALTDDYAKIFQADVLPVEKLVTQERSRHLDRDIGQKWWDPPKSKFIGGDFSVPDPRTKGDRGFSVAVVANGEGRFTVYVYWFEV